MISPVSVSQQEFSEVLERLEQWPPTDRWTLTRRLLDGLGAQKRPLPRPPMTMSLDEIKAMLATDELSPDDDAPTIDELEGILDNGTPPPTAEECERWLEEERMRKYG